MWLYTRLRFSVLVSMCINIMETYVFIFLPVKVFHTIFVFWNLPIIDLYVCMVTTVTHLLPPHWYL